MRTIVHLDANAFFASVEQAADARLRGKPIAVGGESRGIIASASYEARKFGVYTPMPTARAHKLCPRLIVLRGDYERYEQFSNWMFGYAYDFTPNVEKSSIDEGYFDITSNRSRPSVEIALTISKAIRQSLKITVSEGMGSNKLVSQIASKLNKPAAFQTVPAGHEKSFLHPLPNCWLPGIGPKTAMRLNAAGLAHIGQIAATPVDMLALLLGNQAPTTRQFANGVDERPLIPASEPQKSYSQQETFAVDVTDEEYVEAVLRRMADKLFAAVREEDRSVRTLTVKVRYNDRDEDQRAESLREPTDLETDVYGRLRGLLREAWQRRVSLRMVSLKLSNVYDGVFRSELPLEANARNHEARERLAVVLDELRRNKGWSVVQRGHDLRLRDAPRDFVNERTKPQLKIRFDIQRQATQIKAMTYAPLRVRSYYSHQLILTAASPDFAITSLTVDVRTNLPEVRLRMAPQYPVHIQVMDGNGRAVAGAKVGPYPLHIEGQLPSFEGVTDAKGRLDWTNAPVSDFALLATSPSGKVSQEIQLTSEDRQAIFQLRPGMDNEILIRGQAHDAKSGGPVKLESVSYQTGDQEGFKWEGEIQDSGFELAVPQTRFRPEGVIPIVQLKLEAKGYRTLFTSWRDFAEGDWKPDFALQPADMASGKVLLPDGRPASGAQFWISLDQLGGEVICTSPNSYWGPHLIKMQADNGGNFTLPQVPEEHPVLFTHSDGYVKTSLAEIARHPEIHLRPWSSVEGLLKIGGKPKGGVQIRLRNLVFSPTGGFEVLYSAGTAPDGSFSFSNVPEGEYKLYRELTVRSGQPATEDHPMPIVVKPGEALKVDYSNSGRAVIGEAAPDNPDLAVDWSNGSETLTLKQAGPQVPQPALQGYATTKAFYTAMNSYYDSPERLKQARTARIYSLVFQPDGTFRGDDIPPGTYELQITLTKTNQSARYSPYPNPADELGLLTREVVVPPGDGPFVLGTLTVPIKGGGGGAPKSPPVNFTATKLDGAPVSLAQFKGKYVVLAFWALWSDRSAEELKEVQKLQADLGGDPRVTFLGVSLDGDTDAVGKEIAARGYPWTQATMNATNLATISPAFEVSSLPAVYLIDPDGRIVARGLAGERLTASVQRVMQKK